MSAYFLMLPLQPRYPRFASHRFLFSSCYRQCNTFTMRAVYLLDMEQWWGHDVKRKKQLARCFFLHSKILGRFTIEPSFFVQR